MVHQQPASVDAPATLLSKFPCLRPHLITPSYHPPSLIEVISVIIILGLLLRVLSYMLSACMPLCCVGFFTFASICLFAKSLHSPFFLCQLLPPDSPWHLGFYLSATQCTWLLFCETCTYLRITYCTYLHTTLVLKIFTHTLHLCIHIFVCKKYSPSLA